MASTKFRDLPKILLILKSLTKMKKYSKTNEKIKKIIQLKMNIVKNCTRCQRHTEKSTARIDHLSQPCEFVGFNQRRSVLWVGRWIFQFERDLLPFLQWIWWRFGIRGLHSLCRNLMTSMRELQKITLITELSFSNIYNLIQFAPKFEKLTSHNSR